ncbi:DUF2726 domain-containing protein [Pontixanthobacter aquaemixtae]|uniref:DUF2726 domain-containing protein n=1 Tax=Pontixanthobacter aquaemixtae TaxID=1958940 RepID=A0A844ZUB0_9SPHN|nr:DUF2726 domain-containing protein [Pontixanthobacter aquaemixtae]MXO91901.1 DUF2726 domain-containing protein [Pontixanthobacter aquaemixtae]
MDTVSTFLNSPGPTFSLVMGLALAVGGLFLVVLVMGEKSKIGRNRAYWAGRQQTKNGQLAIDQLDKVMSAQFYSRPLLNKPEGIVFKALDQAVLARNSDWQVMAQVSLGEFLGSRDKKAFLSVNSKRVDFALMDEKCRVVHALEYQGTGHHQGSAAARDAVKKEALRKAGIGYHEVIAGHTTPKELRALVEKLVPAG